jgi:hypothetical protein
LPFPSCSTPDAAVDVLGSELEAVENLSVWFTGMEFLAGGNQLMRIVAVSDEGDVWRVEPAEPTQVRQGTSAERCVGVA